MIDSRLRNYLLTAVLLAAVLMGIRSGWEETIKIGCLPVGGQTPPGVWMDGCASDQIGNYGLDVLWFDLDHKAVEGITRAKTLLFGDSRMLTAGSSGYASHWFEDRHIPMYLLAFGAGEQSGWADRLVGKLHPHPDLVVFDADPYFTGQESIPAQAIANDPVGEEKSARSIKAFLDAAPTWCTYFGFPCGRTQRFYREYLDGTVSHQSNDRVWFNRNQAGSFPLEQPGPQDTSHYDEYLANAKALLTKLKVEPRCIVFTIVPNNEMDDTFAKFLAQKLGARVIAPTLPGLSTTDHYHLTQDSAEAWAKQFFAQLAPVAQECVGQMRAGR